jgi:hypothetical protein
MSINPISKPSKDLNLSAPETQSVNMLMFHIIEDKQLNTTSRGTTPTLDLSNKVLVASCLNCYKLHMVYLRCAIFLSDE